MDNQYGKYPIPLTNGLEIRVIIGGIASGTIRSIIETPVEYSKVLFIFLNFIDKIKILIFIDEKANR